MSEETEKASNAVGGAGFLFFKIRRTTAQLGT